jgi:sensor histidine kinase YesM
VIQIKNNRLIGIIHGCVWLILFCFAFAALINVHKPVIAFTHSFLNIVLVMVLFYCHVHWVNIFIEKKKYALFVLCSFLLFAAVMFFRIKINLFLLSKTAILSSQTLKNPAWGVGVLVFLTSGFIWLFAIAYQLLMNRFEKERHNLQQLNAQQAAQFHYLKAQINPHFLFNALNNIYSLTVVKSNDAPKMLLQLSDLLRYAIYDGQQESIELSKEIAHIHKFIALFQLKSEKSLPISFENTGNTEGVFIEPMILIPLVENCFKHSGFEQNEAAFVRIKSDNTAERFCFSTENTFDKNDTQKDKVGGVGLANIQKRLALRYGSDFDFKTAVEGNVFSIFLTINHKK